jgi:hypothetical protein
MKTTSLSRSSVPSPQSAAAAVRHRVSENRNTRHWFAAAALIAALTGTAPAQVPQLINYQGRVAVNNVNFDGTGRFKFALVNADATPEIYWHNSADTTPADGVPDTAVELTVTKGLYSVLLGDATLPNMAVMPSTVFNHPDVRLRVWFDDNVNGSQLLSPDQRIAAVGYAMMAGNVPDAAITSAKLAAGAVGASNIAAGAVGTNQLATGAVEGGNIAAGAVGTAQLADFAITNSKLRPGYVTGTLADGTLDVAPGVFAFSTTFAGPFSVAPSVSLLTPGWALGPVSPAGFSATRSYPPQTIKQIPGILPPSPGRFTSLAVVGGVFPAVSCYDGNINGLKFVRAADPRGTMWNLPGPIAVDNTASAGQYSSLAVVGGIPAIAYHVAGSAADLKFANASDPLGTFWSQPVNLDSVGNVGQFVALAEVAGYPAISYYDATNTSLKFIRAKDPTGMEWETPLTLDSTDDVGAHGSLAVINGNPAISYHDTTNGDLKYIRATDATGTAWGTPLTVDTGDTANVGTYTSLMVVDGYPAISYYDTTNGDLKYIRASDANGTTWGAPLTPDSMGSVGTYSSLQVVNGRPAISYLDGTQTALKYVHASDSTGTVWGAPMILDNTGMTGTHTALAVVDGVPAVSYYEQAPAPGKYKFAVLPDIVPELAWRASDGSIAPIAAASVANGAIGTTQLAPGAVQSGNIASGAVGNAQLAPDAVQSANIVVGAVGTTQLATGAVGNAQLAPDAVQSGNIAAGAVGTTHLADDAVDSSKLAAGAVLSGNIANDAVLGGNIAAGAVGTTHLADNAVVSAKIANGAIGSAKLDSTIGLWTVADTDVFRSAGKVGIGTNAPTTALDVAGIVTATGFSGSFTGNGAGLTGVPVGAGAVGSIQLADNAVLSEKIAAGAVDNAKLANPGVTVNTGDGLSGGGTVALGGSLTLNNSGVLSLTGGGGVTVSAANGAVTLGSTAQSANAPNTIVSRDASGDFGTGSITLSGQLTLPATTSSAVGLVSLGGSPFLHTFGSGNTFVGNYAGNFSMSGYHNTATGAYALNSNTTGYQNTASGRSALNLNTTGYRNTAFGDMALELNSTGNHNTANGQAALYANTTGSYNTANGNNALYCNTTGSNNTAIGYYALFSNKTGYCNTANGCAALFSNTTGLQNTATGFQALTSNTTASYNTANGFEALFANTTGSYNTANGYAALQANTTGLQNTATGWQALYSNTTGISNTANGWYALGSNTTGNYNTATGYAALGSNTTGYYNIALGYGAGTNLTTGGNNIDIGNSGVAGESATIRVGIQGTQTNTYIAGIYGATASGGAAVYVNSSGKLGTTTSSRRFKEAIEDIGDQSEVLLSLRPVSFRYKPEIDPQATPQFGLIAEEVDEVAPALVLRDDKGEIYSVRYEQVNAMLLNEFLKQHRQIADLQQRLAELEKQLVPAPTQP